MSYINYNIGGDACALILCVVNMFLLRSTYMPVKKNLGLFYLANISVGIAAVSSSIYHSIQLHFYSPSIRPLVYIMGDIMYIALASIYLAYILYLSNVADSTGWRRLVITTSAHILFALFCIVQVLSPITRIGIVFDDHGIVKSSFPLNVFAIYYIIMSIFAVAIMVINRGHFVTKIYRCIIQVVVICFLIVIVQLPGGMSTFTVFSFILPIVTVLFLFHYNAYDQDTGTLDRRSFEAYVDDTKNKQLGMIRLQIDGLDTSSDRAKDLKTQLYHFNEKYFKEMCTFKTSDDTLTLVYKATIDVDPAALKQAILLDFGKLRESFKSDYKLVFISANDKLNKAYQYEKLLGIVTKKMDWNSIETINESQISEFLHGEIVENTLRDIDAKHNLNDERVLVYCQPVYDTKKGQYSTSEALMRLKIPGFGMIYPDEFIPIAEREGLIHTLSEIILNKTCIQVKNFCNAGYDISRVSVNFSIGELHSHHFIDDIDKIIADTGVDPSKIAFELTESRNEQDFAIVKKTMEYFQAKGIKFYLDDFGTGYSNFERIMQLPFDIIKFDRSLTILSGKNKSSGLMVLSFAQIFESAQYLVLFEGIETPDDEERCEAMGARYLQGYKYSRPIPLEDLSSYLDKRSY